MSLKNHCKQPISDFECFFIDNEIISIGSESFRRLNTIFPLRNLMTVYDGYVLRQEILQKLERYIYGKH